jgi:hypothetical protein
MKFALDFVYLIIIIIIIIINGSMALCSALATISVSYSRTQSVGLRAGISPSRGVHRTTQTQIKHTQPSIPRMEFEPTTPLFERAKTVGALDHAATVIGLLRY